MGSAALTLALGAAVLHASWNALVKHSGDRAITLAGIAAGHGILGSVMVLFVPLPDPASWWALFVSTVVHYAYYVLLFQAYRIGDLSLVYPIARGLAPVLVAVSAYALIGEDLGLGGWLGLAAVTAGIGLLSVSAGAGRASLAAVGFAVAVGLAIAVYSYADGVGVRATGPNPFSYISWLFFLEFPVPLAILASRYRRGLALSPRVAAIGLAGGVVSLVSYAMVLVANTLAPLGAVSAVRESSVIIAALIGVVLFGERPWRGRLVAAICVALGVVALASA